MLSDTLPFFRQLFTSLAIEGLLVFRCCVAAWRNGVSQGSLSHPKKPNWPADLEANSDRSSTAQHHHKEQATETVHNKTYSFLNRNIIFLKNQNFCKAEPNKLALMPFLSGRVHPVQHSQRDSFNLPWACLSCLITG